MNERQVSLKTVRLILSLESKGGQWILLRVHIDVVSYDEVVDKHLRIDNKKGI